MTPSEPSEASVPASSASNIPAPEQDAMVAELRRAVQQLKLAGAPSSFGARLMGWRGDLAAASASVGHRVETASLPISLGNVFLDVGTPDENPRVMYAGAASQAALTLPIEPSAWASARALWIALEQAFRGAVTAHATMRSAATTLDVASKEHGLHALEPATQTLSGTRPPLVSEAELAALAERASRWSPSLRRLDDLRAHAACASGTLFVMDDRGMVRAHNEGEQVLVVLATYRDAEGQPHDHARAMWWTGPINADVETAALMLSRRVTDEALALAQAELIDEDYDGPVLLTDQAAAQFLGRGISQAADGAPVAWSEAGPMEDLRAAWQRRMGKQVMPEEFTLIDDPALLLGDADAARTFDAEGGHPEALTLVERGVLRGLLTARGVIASHSADEHRMRLTRGLSGGLLPFGLRLDVARTIPLDRARAQLLERARADGWDYAYELAHVRDDALLGTPLRTTAVPDARAGEIVLGEPVLLYRLDDRGRTLVRGATLDGFEARALRRIRAATRERVRQTLRLSPVGIAAGASMLLTETVAVLVDTPNLLVDGLHLRVERAGAAERELLAHPARRGSTTPAAAATTSAHDRDDDRDGDRDDDRDARGR